MPNAMAYGALPYFAPNFLQSMSNPYFGYRTPPPPTATQLQPQPPSSSGSGPPVQNRPPNPPPPTPPAVPPSVGPLRNPVPPPPHPPQANQHLVQNMILQQQMINNFLAINGKHPLNQVSNATIAAHMRLMAPQHPSFFAPQQPQPPPPPMTPPTSGYPANWTPPPAAAAGGHLQRPGTPPRSAATPYPAQQQMIRGVAVPSFSEQYRAVRPYGPFQMPQPPPPPQVLAAAQPASTTSASQFPPLQPRVMPAPPVRQPNPQFANSRYQRPVSDSSKARKEPTFQLLEDRIHIPKTRSDSESSGPSATRTAAPVALHSHMDYALSLLPDDVQVSAFLKMPSLISAWLTQVSLSIYYQGTLIIIDQINKTCVWVTCL